MGRIYRHAGEANETMKYLFLLMLTSFGCICFLAATSDLSELKIDDWTTSSVSNGDAGISEGDTGIASAPGLDAAASYDSQSAPKLVLMKFGATWCPPCRMIDKELKTLGRSKLPVEIRKVDVDQRPDLARQYHVSSIPRLILLQDGEKVGDLTGYRSVDQLTDWIKDSASPAALAGTKRSAGPSVVHTNPFLQ